MSWCRVTMSLMGRIVLNVAATAVQSLVVGNEAVLFSARFGGRPFPVELPIAAVVGIYARENGQGMLFADEDTRDPAAADDEAKETDGADAGSGSADGSAGGSDDKGKRPALRVVK